MHRYRIGEAALELSQGDITRAETRAIANAANSMLIPGGGVDGAIHRAAGPELQEALRRLKRELPGGVLETGKAVLTPGFGLRAAYVIHCVGPIYDREGERSASLLASCYREALRWCEREGIDSVTFPSISTGVYGYPVEDAAMVALETIRDVLSRWRTVTVCRFALFDETTLAAYRLAAGRLLDR